MKKSLLFALLLAVSASFAAADLAGQPATSNKPLVLGAQDTELLQRIARLRIRLTKAGMHKFPELDLSNQKKAEGFIAALLDRAEQQALKVIPPGKHPWSWDGFTDPVQMTQWAEEYLATLENGRDPFRGKFGEPGVHVIDHALIEKDGRHHLFYIRGAAATHWPEFPTDNFGHAVSDDLLNWSIEEPVLQSTQGTWDGYQVWAPYIIDMYGKYYMFYTGVSEANTQAIGLAISADLYHWERYGNKPIIVPGPWAAWSEGGASDGRDPVVLRDGDTFYCYYTARLKDAPEYCVGIASSTDLLDWKDEGYIRFENSLDTPPESPYAFIRNGKYYLIYTSYKYGTVYSVSDDPVKGWKQIPGEQASLISGVSASEIYRPSDGKWYLSLISHPHGLHFFEIRRLLWEGGEKPQVAPIWHD